MVIDIFPLFGYYMRDQGDCMQQQSVLEMTSEEIQHSYEQLMEGASDSLLKLSKKTNFDSFSYFERATKLKDTEICYSTNTSSKCA
jgi:hypothetical protein